MVEAAVEDLLGEGEALVTEAATAEDLEAAEEAVVDSIVSIQVEVEEEEEEVEAEEDGRLQNQHVNVLK